MDRAFFGRLLTFGSPVAAAAVVLSMFVLCIAYVPTVPTAVRVAFGIAGAAVAFFGPAVGAAIVPGRMWRRVVGGCFAAVLGLLAFAFLTETGEVVIRRIYLR